MEATTQSGTPAGAGKSSLNPDALNELLGQMVNDLGAAVNGALVVLGDGLGTARATKFSSRIATPQLLVSPLILRAVKSRRAAWTASSPFGVQAATR
jgi:hypothetical protein